MSDLRKAAEMALDALNMQTPLDQREFELRNAAIEALRQALAQPELQQRTGDCLLTGICAAERHKIYTAPPKREWVGLTRRELDIATLGLEDLSDCYKAIESKLKEKNT